MHQHSAEKSTRTSATRLPADSPVGAKSVFLGMRIRSDVISPCVEICHAFHVFDTSAAGRSFTKSRRDNVFDVDSRVVYFRPKVFPDLLYKKKIRFSQLLDISACICVWFLYDAFAVPFLFSHLSDRWSIVARLSNESP